MTKIVIISDTHGLHRQLPHILPEGDIIVHCGDITPRGTMEDCLRGFGWFNALPYKYRICIAGNHDLFLDPDHPGCPSSFSAINAILPVCDGFFYLNDSGCEVEGIKFWGSPVQPAFLNWGYNRNRGGDIKKHWDKIPKGTDVLLTHGPAYGFLDECTDLHDPSTKIKVGCVDLAKTIAKIKPKLHVCGHIHSGYGYIHTKDTLHVNASVCTEAYEPINRPIVVDYSKTECSISK
jgi:predicted phosphodiesterase